MARLARRKSESVIFTSGATKANALALWGAVEGAMDAGKTRITRLFVSAIEHKSVLKTADAHRGTRGWHSPRNCAGNRGWCRGYRSVEDGVAQGKGRALVAVMAANNETGVVQPVAEISRLCREAGALLLVDAVTAAGKIGSMPGFAITCLVGATSWAGRKASGALIVSAGAPLRSAVGGRRQQKGLRAGTENVSGIAGFGAAAKAALSRRRARAARGLA